MVVDDSKIKQNYFWNFPFFSLTLLSFRSMFSLVSDQAHHTHCLPLHYTRNQINSLNISRKAYLQSETVHVGVEEDLNKWDEKRKDEISINHLNVGGWWEAIANLIKNILNIKNNF